MTCHAVRAHARAITGAAIVSITETNKIDLVGTRPDSSIVRLVITDHLAWDDFASHARLLQDKVETYLTFIDSGQLATLPNIPEVPEIRIEVMLQQPPSEEARGFLARLERAVTAFGVAFDVEVWPGDAG